MPRGQPQRDVMEGRLPLVGFVQARPIGQSHYRPAPWQVSPDTPYQPAILSENAMRKGIEKAREDLPPVISDERLDRVFQYMRMRLSPIWSGDNELTYAEAVYRLNWVKSPGYPYYFTCEDKACAITCFGGEIMVLVHQVLEGEDVWLPYTLTLKDELRTADRVKDEKTRVFSACNIVSLIASKMLFDKQNDKLRSHLLEHPLTIGISVPGPAFVTAIKSLGEECNCTAGDASGCDQRFYLPFARVIRDLRKSFLPEGRGPAVDKLYDDDFCSTCVTSGCVYRMLHGKSGRNNTGDDNGLLLWMSAADYVMETTKCGPSNVDDYFQALINGDDSVFAWYEPCNAQGYQRHCKQFNLQIELEDQNPRFAVDCTFLSHHLKQRFIPNLGDVVIAAGNFPKLVSSIEWVRRNSDFSDEENALVHLLGLRINLWPWKHEFDDIEELLDSYVSSLVSTPRIRNMLKARISEQQIMGLHFRFEGAILATLGEELGDQEEYCVRDSIISAIFEIVSQNGIMAGKHTQEMARRLAQSKKDKKQSTHKHPKGGVSLNSAAKPAQKHMAPAAVGFESSSKSGTNKSNRFKDGIVVEGIDHLEFVVVPASGEVVGGVLNEIYINPLEFGGTRLEKFGQLYEKYLFDYLEFEYTPAVGSDTPGMIILAYDRDIDDPTPPPTEGGLKQYTSFEDAKDGNNWLPLRIKCKLTQPDSGYYTNPVGSSSDRLSYQGQFYVATVVPTGIPSKTLGRLRMHFRCHFFTPQLDNGEASANQVAPQTPSAGAANYDFLKPSADSASQPNGLPAFKPKLDSNGKAFIDLAMGVYKWYVNVAGGTLTTASANQLLEFFNSVLVPNTPMPDTAPQPWIEVLDANTLSVNATDPIQSFSALFNLGVPRGGAKLYQNWTTDGGSTGAAFNVLWELARLGGYNPTQSGYSLARFQGREECANSNTQANVLKAIARAKGSKLKRLTRHAPFVPEIEDCHMEVCSPACLDDHRRTSPTEEEVKVLKREIEELKARHASASLPSAALSWPPKRDGSNPGPFTADNRR